MGTNKLHMLGTRLSTPSCGNVLIYFLVYVDDLIITCSDPSIVNNIIQQLDSKFSIKDLEVLYFS